ncbi:MAG: hypothetical protein AMS26_06945, partial [Bacteroides sp. SM23_62]
MRNILFKIVSVSLLISCSKSSLQEYYVPGVANPVISLNGTWKLNINPSPDFLEQSIYHADWKDIQVPGECMMQGFPVKHDQPVVYKRRVDIPQDYGGKIIRLRFDGVYSYARVWVNGKYIRDHSGGFTRWECDITPHIEPGESAVLCVEVTDRMDEISYGSGYAKHPIGGILRDVSLLALPGNFPEDVTIRTDLDGNHQNASLIISGRTKQRANDAKVTLELLDSDRKRITLENPAILLDNEQSFQITNLVNNPQKWDAEHPNLYSLRVSYSERDELLWQKVYSVGFREITLDGNILLINGREVKLRGACRHDIHPMLGRVSTPGYERKDVMLAKEANMNFIRTSHYPPTENFLKLCDEYGIYIEDETAVCFVGTYRTRDYYPGAT